MTMTEEQAKRAYELLIRLWAHQHGCTVEHVEIVRKDEADRKKEGEPA